MGVKLDTENRLTQLETLIPIIHKDLNEIKNHVSVLRGFRIQVTTVATTIAIFVSAAWQALIHRG